MIHERQGQDMGFTLLTDFHRVDTGEKRLNGNVVKRSRVHPGGVQKIGLADGEKDEPRIVVHKNGESVESIEFTCICGRSATLRLDYRGE
jgi:hypothetical protein